MMKVYHHVSCFPRHFLSLSVSPPLSVYTCVSLLNHLLCIRVTLWSSVPHSFVCFPNCFPTWLFLYYSLVFRIVACPFLYFAYRHQRFPFHPAHLCVENKNTTLYKHNAAPVNTRDVLPPRVCAGALVMSASCCAVHDVCRVPRLEWRPCCTAKLRGGFLRAGRHVGKIWPLLPAAPPVLEQATSAWGCGSLLTLLAGGAWSRLSLSGPWRQLLKLNWRTTDPVNFFWTVCRSGTQEELFLFSW